MSMNSLDVFDPYTTRWFFRAIGTPTAVQMEAWPVIASGRHTRVSAPTGTGKTLSAFLVFLDRLKTQLREGTLKQELQLIYVSPLKSLAGDIRENLRRPLSGIAKEEYDDGDMPDRLPPDLSVAIRTGDTPQNERRRMIKTPPHILITTPESLYLMLTGKSGQSILRTARWIIIDELHALIDTKRGAHLMLSLARLDKLCPNPLQRIGLSATIMPLNKAAEYLSPDPVTIVAPDMKKAVRLAITSPLPGKGTVKKDSIWQDLAGAVYTHCGEARSVIAFVEGRAYAEKLASRIIVTAPPQEKLEIALKTLCDLPCPPALWESVLLPARVGGYRPELLDALLAQGSLFWRINPDSGFSFHQDKDIDWNADLTEAGAAMEGQEKLVYEALQKRGASFMHRLDDVLSGESPYDTLLRLAEKGLVYANSFVPVRQ